MAKIAYFTEILKDIAETTKNRELCTGKLINQTISKNIAAKEKEFSMKNHIYIISLGLLYFFSCQIDKDLESKGGNNAYIVPIEREDSLSEDSLWRIPTIQEFERLFQNTMTLSDGQAILSEGEESISFPLQGYSPNEGTVALYHTKGSYWAQGDSIFQISDKGEYTALPNPGGYHTLRYVSDTLHKNSIRIGGLHWSLQNEGEGDGKVSYFNQSGQSITYRSLSLSL